MPGDHVFRRAAVAQHRDFVGRQAPGDIAVAQEVAGRDELIDQRQHAFQVLLAKHELVGRAVGEAAVAGIGRSAGAELVAVGRDHLAVIGADRIIVVQGIDDPCFRHDAPDQEQHLHAQQQRVVDVDYIRAEGLEQGGQVRHDAVQVDLALVEAVEMAGPQNQFVGAAAYGLEVGAGLLLPVDLVGAGEEHCLDPVHVLHVAEQVMGEDFGAAGMEARVVVADEQDAGECG